MVEARVATESFVVRLPGDRGDGDRARRRGAGGREVDREGDLGGAAYRGRASGGGRVRGRDSLLGLWDGVDPAAHGGGAALLRRGLLLGRVLPEYAAVSALPGRAEHSDGGELRRRAAAGLARDQAADVPAGGGIPGRAHTVAGGGAAGSAGHGRGHVRAALVGPVGGAEEAGGPAALARVQADRVCGGADGLGRGGDDTAPAEREGGGVALPPRCEHVLAQRGGGVAAEGLRLWGGGPGLL